VIASTNTVTKLKKNNNQEYDFYNQNNTHGTAQVEKTSRSRYELTCAVRCFCIYSSRTGPRLRIGWSLHVDGSLRRDGVRRLSKCNLRPTSGRRMFPGDRLGKRYLFLSGAPMHRQRDDVISLHIHLVNICHNNDNLNSTRV